MPCVNFSEVKIVDDYTDAEDVIRDIISSENREEAFHVLNVGELLVKHKSWLCNIPRVEPHYAVKCNSHPTVIKLLAAIGAKFDCASKGEIMLVQKYGVFGNRIIYANAVKSPSHIAYAKTVGVSRMTADCPNELFKIKQLYPEAEIIIRIRCDAAKAGMPLGRKFGCDPHTTAIELIKLAKDLGQHLYGFSFHVGSPCEELEAYARGIRICKNLIDYARSIGCEKCSLINIGGGIPGDNDFNIKKFANVINEVIKDIDSSIKFVSEPGRYYVQSSGYAVSRVIGKKSVIEDGRKCYQHYINDGIFGSFSAKIMRNPPLLLNDSKNIKRVFTTLWGPSGDPFDYVVKEYLPNYKVGDFLLWKNMGAYTTVFANHFNGFQPPTVYPFIRKRHWEALETEILNVNM